MAVVVHDQFERIGMQSQRDAHLVAGGVPDGVVERLFEGEEEIVAGLGRERPGGHLDRQVEPAAHIGRDEEVVRVLAHVVDQAVERVVLGIDGPDDLIERTRQIAGGIIDAREHGGGVGGLGERTAPRLAQHRDSGEARAEVVVDVLCDACALALDLMLALHALDLPLHAPADDMAGKDDDAAGRGQAARPEKPPRLPEKRVDGKREGRALGVPDAIVVASDHAKTIGAGPEPAVESRPPVACLDPGLVDAIQAVLEQNLVRLDEAQSAESEFEAPVVGAQRLRDHSLAKRRILSVDEERLE